MVMDNGNYLLLFLDENRFVEYMKNSILLLAITILLNLATTAQAQKNEESDYNLRKAYELLENKEEAEALKYINKQI